jgi:hypothetical protein
MDAIHPSARNLPWFDPDAARQRLQTEGAEAADVPNYRHYVEQAVSRWPDAWRNAHTDNARTEEFARTFNSFMHYDVDANCGNVGKRGSSTDISDDGTMLKHPTGPIIDIITGERLRFFDIIAGAGSASASAAWQDLSGTTPSAGLWLKPERVHTGTGGGGTGGGGTPTKPTPEDLLKLLPDRGRFMTAMDRLHAYYKAPEGLQRDQGLWTGSGPDLEGIAAWLLDTWLRAVLGGKSDDAAFDEVKRNIRLSAEWRGKHPGETP